MEKVKVKLILDIFMALAFLIVGITGLLKLPFFRISNFLGIYDSINFRTMSQVHDSVGVMLVVLIILHFVLNFNWLKCAFASFFKKNKEGDTK